MAITISEKQHWRERIEKRINRRILDVKSKDPAHFSQIETRAKQIVAANLGVSECLERIKEIDEERDLLNREQQRTLCSAYEILTGKKEDHHYSIHSEILQQMKPHIQRVQEELLQDTDLGREVAQLEAEKENLLDTVWLATSPRQMSDLWIKLLKLLGEETTVFQREILETAKPAD